MYKGKTFRFKNAEAREQFRQHWQGQDDQQSCVTDYIGDRDFVVISSTPKGGIRAIQKCGSPDHYYTTLAEPLIDQCEIVLFFEEVKSAS